MDEKLKETIDNITNTEDTTAEFTTEDIENNKVMAILAYISILFLIPLFAAKESKYARFHTNQGIILFIVSFVLGFITGFIGLIPFIGMLISTVVNIVTFILMVIGIVNAATGKAKKLPVIGNLFTVLK